MEYRLELETMLEGQTHPRERVMVRQQWGWGGEGGIAVGINLNGTEAFP